VRVYLLPLLVLFVAGYASLAFAETEYEIKIPTGASDSGAPFFWSEKSTGATTGIITISLGDSVTWQNADTEFHTITSISQKGENVLPVKDNEDGIFDSGLFAAGESYTRDFGDLGDFYYYCSLHTWMNGVVHVVKNPGNVQSIDNVGSGYSDDGLGFKIKYILDTNLQKAVHVNPDEKSLTFKISGGSENDDITFILPFNLIENPNAVFVDGVMTEFESKDTSSGTKLIIPITVDSQEIKIMGTKVIPEFGFLAISILSISIVSILFLTRSKLSMFR
jgi:predicted secreted protein with PEFG-CTERM motif